MITTSSSCSCWFVGGDEAQEERSSGEIPVKWRSSEGVAFAGYQRTRREVGFDEARMFLRWVGTFDEGGEADEGVNGGVVVTARCWRGDTRASALSVRTRGGKQRRKERL